MALVPSCQSGQAGEGLLVAVKRSPYYTVMDWGSNNTSLWVKLQFQAGPPLVIGVCYLPPQGSPQLRDNDLDTRMTSLSSHFLAADKEGYVLLGGDFNARVGGCGELSPHTPGVRGCTDTTVNGYGRKLLQFCNRTGAFLCTGRVEGDRDGVPTYHATSRTGATRIDHMIASPRVLPLVSHSRVLTGWAGSDHYFYYYYFFFRGESPLHIRVHAKANLGGPNAVYQEEALARRQGSWCSVRHERSQEPVGSRRWGQRKVNVNATGRGPKLTARRLGGDKQRTGPGDVHPGLGIGRAARRLRNNCSGRHERN